MMAQLLGCMEELGTANREIDRLRNRNEAQHVEIKRLTEYSFGQDKELNRLGAELATAKADNSALHVDLCAAVGEATRLEAELANEQETNKQFPEWLANAITRAEAAEARIKELESGVAERYGIETKQYKDTCGKHVMRVVVDHVQRSPCQVDG